MRTLIAGLHVWLFATSVSAQERPAPANAHAALAPLAGKWETRARFWTWEQPSAAPMECTATVTAKLIMGGRFLLQNVEGECMKRPLEAIGVIGYDSATAQYEAASFSSMGPGITRHVGKMNDAGEIVLHSGYQDQTTGKRVDRRTVRTMISKGEWVETAHETRNNVERKVMEIRARRVDNGAA